MKILMVGGHTADTTENEPIDDALRFFKDAAAQADPANTVSFCHLDRLVFWVSPDAFEVTDADNECPVDRYDLVIFRGKIRAHVRIAYCLSAYLAAKNITFLNDYRPYRPSTKLAQAVTMRELRLPFAGTLCAEDMAAAVKSLPKYLNFPIIAKDTVGSHGAHNFLVHDQAELEKIIADHPTITFLLQEYVPNDCDYRVLVLGGRELIICRRSTSGSHLHNTSQGGEAALVSKDEFPSETLEQAHRFARKLGMTMAGVDVMRNTKTGQLVFLEVNSQPQLVTGAFPDDKKALCKRFFQDAASGENG